MFTCSMIGSGRNKCEMHFIVSVFFLTFYFNFWLRHVLVAAHGLFVVACRLLVVACGFSLSSCGTRAPGRVGSAVGGMQALSLRCVCSVVVAHRLSCFAACGIFPDQGSNPCPLHWKADSLPPHHQGSPKIHFIVM